MIRQITIVGTGLIGGSLGLALKRGKFRGRVVGCDRKEVLARARKKKAIDAGVEDVERAVAGSEVVVLAAPVGQILDLIGRLGPRLDRHTLLSDVGSTKAEIVARARAVFGAEAPRRFLGGHPMAGKERSGIEHADAALFQGAPWLLTPQAGQKVEEGRSGEFVKLVRRLGARPVTMDAERHDRLCAWASHLPQLVATALAAALEEEFGSDAGLKAVAGRGLRDMTRLAASPYAVWRDVVFTNSANLEAALLGMEQALAHVRENLKTAELREEFERANQFHPRDTEAQRNTEK